MLTANKSLADIASKIEDDMREESKNDELGAPSKLGVETQTFIKLSSIQAML